MFLLKPLRPPMVYKIEYDSFNKGHYLLEDSPRFIEPPKYYGNIIRYSNHFFDTFNQGKNSIGVMLVGSSGSGKTLMSERIANLALSNGYIVVKVVNIKVDLKLIDYIDSLENAVILLDEFAKNFYPDMQNKMLNMLSNSTSGKKLFIITENSKSMISPLIRNRPGRVRYRIYFGKLERDVVIEYCKDFNIDPNFAIDLLSIYNDSAIFSFDHLQAIVSEHIMYPEYSVRELIDILNLDILGGAKSFKLIEIKDKDGNIVPHDEHSIDYIEWFIDNENSYYYPRIKKDSSNDSGLFVRNDINISFTKKNVISSNEKEFIVDINGYILTYKLIDEK